jgi:hypothetical protein
MEIGLVARYFNGVTTDTITLNTGWPTTTAAVSCSAWYNLNGTPAGFPSRYAILGATANNGADINYYFAFDNVGVFMQVSNAPSSFFSMNGAKTFDTGVWHNVIIVSDFTTAGTAFYIDGVALTNSGVLGVTPELVNTDSRIGRAGANADYFKGSLADVALWTGIKLTLTEVTALAKGARAKDIRPKSLGGYFPLAGFQSPEPDLSGIKNFGTLTGTQPAFGPPLMQFTPRWPQWLVPPPPAPVVMAPAIVAAHFSRRVNVVGY